MGDEDFVETMTPEDILIAKEESLIKQEGFLIKETGNIEVEVKKLLNEASFTDIEKVVVDMFFLRKGKVNKAEFARYCTGLDIYRNSLEEDIYGIYASL